MKKNLLFVMSKAFVVGRLNDINMLKGFIFPVE